MRARRAGIQWDAPVLMLGYSLLLTMVLLLGSPWWLARMLTTARYREGLPERLGRVPATLQALALGKRVVWIHAVSVGEVLAASSLIAELEGALGPAWQIVVSTTTRTGQELARRRFGPGRVFYFPLDFRFAVRAWLRVLRPELALLTESELWPRLLHECAREGVPVAVVNARVSDRTLRRTLRFAGLWRRMAQDVSRWLPQSEDDAARLIQLGVLPSKVEVTGNLKYDTRTPAESPLVSAIRSGVAGRPVVVAGSTVAYGTTPEEGLVLDAMRTHVWPELPNAVLILAPRHPSRFAEAGVLASQSGTKLCASELMRAVPGYRVQERVVLLDTIGDLAALYRIADVAFVGGSLVPHGGHNPLEPAQFGVPVVVGPHTQNFREIVARLRAAEGIVVLDATEPEALAVALLHLLTQRAEARALGERGRLVCQEQRGATARTIAALMPLLHPDARKPRVPDAEPGAPVALVPSSSKEQASTGASGLNARLQVPCTPSRAGEIP